MKKAAQFLLIALAGTLIACSSTYYAGSSAPDDVYYSSKSDVYRPVSPGASSSSYQGSDYSNPNSGSQPAQETYSNYETQQTSPSPSGSYDNAAYDDASANQDQQADYYSTERSGDGSGNTYVTNNYYYNQDDYYDYAYSARLRRFYSPYFGYNYYDPIYTNSYWYDYSPVNWGVSIYTGYSWWAPTSFYYSPFVYSPGFNIGINFGWGTPCYAGWYSPGFYPYWNRPWGGWGGWYSPWGYNSYWAGYNNGYWAGYNHGYFDGSWGISNPYYFNSFDGNFNYGPRGASVGGNSPRPSGSHTFGTGRMAQSVGDKYTEAVSQGRISRPNPDIKNIGRSDDTRPSSAGETAMPAPDKSSNRPGVSSPDVRPENRPFGQQGNEGKTNTPRNVDDGLGNRPGAPSETSPGRPDKDIGRSFETAPSRPDKSGGRTGNESAPVRPDKSSGRNNNMLPEPVRTIPEDRSTSPNRPDKSSGRNEYDIPEPVRTMPEDRSTSPSRPDKGYSKPTNPRGGDIDERTPSRTQPISPERNNNQKMDNRSREMSKPQTLPDRSTTPSKERTPSRSTPSNSRDRKTPMMSEERDSRNYNGYSKQEPSRTRPSDVRQERKSSVPERSYSAPRQERTQPSDRTTRPSMEMPRSREQQRTPTFQPRNEPKQFSSPGRRR